MALLTFWITIASLTLFQRGYHSYSTSDHYYGAHPIQPEADEVSGLTASLEDVANDAR